MSIQQERHTPDRPPSAPPPYTYPPTLPNDPGPHIESQPPPPPLHFGTVAHPRLTGPLKSPRRPLPPLPEPRVDTVHLDADELLASGSRSTLQVSSSSSSSPHKPSPPLPLLSPLAISPSSPIPSVSPSTRAPKNRPFIPLLSLLRPSRSRHHTKQIAAREAQSPVNDGGRQAEEDKRAAELERAKRAAAEERAHKAVTQSNDAKEAVRSNVWSLLSRQLPSDEDYEPIFKKCAQICEGGGLDLSAVLQEPLIDGKPPVYWAILNGPSTSSQGGDAAFDTLVDAFLGACQPLKDTTITAIRLACMLTSNNVLLQQLFRRFPSLSPLTPGDAILLSSAGGGDVVDVDETQDGTGTFVARIQVRRFRLRMRVSGLIKVEFVTADRLWTITFSIRSENCSDGPSESRWLLFLGLADHSMPACVDGDLVISGSPPSTNEVDYDEPTFTIPIRRDVCELNPGSESAIRIRLDDGPMGPHLRNESQTLVDSDGTLHAQFTVRLLRQTMPSSFLSPSIDFSDTASQTSSALDAMTTTTSSRSEPPRSPIGDTRKKKQAQDPSKPVYTSLRRGGR